MRKKLNRYLPPGADQKSNQSVFRGLYILAIAISALFLLQYYQAYQDLFVNTGISKMLRPDAYMHDFVSMMANKFIGFAAVMLGALLLAVRYYLSFKEGSMSIYLMRRLPDRRELWRRCLVVPALLILVCLITMLVLLLSYYLIYMLVTPEECLRPMQWRILWSNIREVLLCFR